LRSDYEYFQYTFTRTSIPYEVGQEHVTRAFFIRIFAKGTQTGIELVTRFEFDQYGELLRARVEEE
jgi:hypothetical protein